MNDLDVIDDPAVASAVLEPLRSRILAALVEPGSASTVAEVLGETRQKVNYHLRELERVGLITLVETRPRRGLTERVVVASARAYVVSPEVLGDNAAQLDTTDRLSTRYLVALAARMIREVGALARGAEKAGQPLATLSIDTDVRFGSAAARAEFTHELADAITRVVAKHHDETTEGGRWHRLVVASHQRPPQ